MTMGLYPVTMMTAGAPHHHGPPRHAPGRPGALPRAAADGPAPPSRLWFVAVLVNQRIMTWFLWHLTVTRGLAHLLLALDAWVLLPELLTGLVVLVMGRFERPRADGRPAPPAWKPIAAAVCVIAGLAVIAGVGVAGKSGVTWRWPPLLPVMGMWALGTTKVRVVNRHDRRIKVMSEIAQHPADGSADWLEEVLIVPDRRVRGSQLRFVVVAGRSFALLEGVDQVLPCPAPAARTELRQEIPPIRVRAVMEPRSASPRGASISRSGSLLSMEAFATRVDMADG